MQTSRQQFETLVRDLATDIAGRHVDADLQAYLNGRFPPEGTVFRRLADACRAGIAEGWLCNREQAGIRFGGVMKPGPDTQIGSEDFWGWILVTKTPYPPSSAR